MNKKHTLKLSLLSLSSLFAIIALIGITLGGTAAAAIQQVTETPPETPTLEVTVGPSETPTLAITETPTVTPAPTITTSAPTLIPPTPIPQANATEVASQPTISALARVKETHKLIVGTYYNAHPFTWYNELGEVAGYEADILRAIGIDLGIEIDFVQVTRHNAIETLMRGDVDILIGQQVHSQDREAYLSYAHPYYLNQERMVVIQESAYTDLQSLAGQPIGVEIGSRSEQSLRSLNETRGLNFDIRTFFSEGAALDALANGEVQGMVGELDSLSRAGRQHMRLIDEPVLLEPYAIVMRRWDVNARNLLNRSLQKLKASGRLDEIANSWFGEGVVDFDSLVPVYEMLYQDARTLNEFNTDIPMPANPVLVRIQNGQPIRVAGLISPSETAPAHIRLMDNFNRALIEDMARRWGAQLEYVPNSVLNAVDLVANGQADIAVGISPRWDGADRCEYSLPYIQHRNRLMIPANKASTITGFSSLLGTGWVIAYFADKSSDADEIQRLADYFNVGSNIKLFEIIREDQAIFTMVDEDNISMIFGDNLRLTQLMREYSQPDSVKILDTDYGDLLSITFASPRNDEDFRLMIDATLQEMAQDGTYQSLWGAQFGVGDPVNITRWPETNPDGQPGL
ncbi:MAG TPA: transporter substrate-binding domain-containing protein [Aggregatilineaceae bacterium]|nr:transporter substrate-binding domain-containing protein [Aggregatilineaceae bacterium]